MATLPHPGAPLARWRRYDWLGSRWVIALAILASLTVTALAWRVSDQAIQLRAKTIFDDDVDVAVTAIERRMRAMEQVLLGGAGLFRASNEVSRDEWKVYVETMQLDRYNPGTEGFGFARWVPAEEQASLVERVPGVGRRPTAKPRDASAIVTYLEPQGRTDARALGYDMWSDPTRREALARARDDGTPAMTGRVQLGQERGVEARPGVLLVVPIYQPGWALDSTRARQAALRGFVYSPLPIADFMTGVVEAERLRLRLAVYDGGELADGGLLFDSLGEGRRTEAPARFVATRQIDVGGRLWTLRAHSAPGFGQMSPLPLLIASSGAALSLLLALVIRRLFELGQRSRSQAERASAEWRLSEQRYRSVVEASPQAMLRVDQGGRLTLINAQAEALFGWQRDALFGQPLTKVLPRATQPWLDALRARSRVTLGPWAAVGGQSMQARHLTGGDLAVEVGLNPVDTPEGPQSLVTIVDVRQRLVDRERIESALREKTALLQEIHHRVKNNLQVVASLLELQAGRSGTAVVRDALAESRGRVEAMALIHQLLYEMEDFSGIELRGYLRRMAALIVDSYRIDTDRVTVHVEGCEVRLDLARAVPCGLIVNELICNSLKHGFPDQRSGRIGIALQRSGGDVLMTLDDDGVGLPPQLDPTKTRTLGLQLVRSLAAQVGASLEIGPGPGARFTLRMPLDETPATARVDSTAPRAAHATRNLPT